MKKFTLLVSILAFFLFGRATNVVPVEDAVKVSKNFLSERLGSMEAQNKAITLTYTEYSETGTPLYYRFQIDNKGFIIISATELSAPVLAFSLESNFNGKAGGDYMCKKYKTDLKQLVSSPKADMKADAGWAHYLTDNFQLRQAKDAKGTPSVEPLVTTRWTQETFYNAYCPMHPDADIDWDMRTPVGCVALTMSNIMFYYRFPESGMGGVTYIPRDYDDETGEVLYTYPVQSENFAQAHYNYDAMPDMTTEYCGSLAKMIHQCGVSVRMGYGPEGSGAQSEDALVALQEFFKYSPKAKFQNIGDIVPSPDLAHLWPEKLVSELDAHRPLFFSANSKTSGGHAYIVDGYVTAPVTETTNDTYFHVNWGWAGVDNGFYLVKKMTSSSSGVFNEGESIMVGLEPDAEVFEYTKPATSEKRVTASMGTISDGGGNLKYAPNSNRRWVIACPDAKSYTFQFSKLKVKSGDKVIIYNGGTEADGVKKEYSGDYLMAAATDYAGLDGSVAADFTGQPLPSAITVNKDSVLVVFTSNADENTDYGFVLEYKVNSYYTDACDEQEQIMNSWHGVITDKPNNATDDTPYRAASVCKHTLRIPYTTGYTFAFHKFDLKEGDFVDFYNVESTLHPEFIARYDIYNMPTGVFTVNASKVRVKFVSDNWNQGNGFELEYYQIAGIDQESGLNDVSIYPNPATTQINVSIDSENAQNIKATVVDMTGKVIYADEFGHIGGTQVYQIPVGNMAKGIYFLNLQSEQGKAMHKFIVQ